MSAEEEAVGGGGGAGAVALSATVGQEGGQQGGQQGQAAADAAPDSAVLAVVSEGVVAAEADNHATAPAFAEQQQQQQQPPRRMTVAAMLGESTLPPRQSSGAVARQKVKDFAKSTNATLAGMFARGKSDTMSMIGMSARTLKREKNTERYERLRESFFVAQWELKLAQHVDEIVTSDAVFPSAEELLEWLKSECVRMASEEEFGGGTGGSKQDSRDDGVAAATTSAATSRVVVDATSESDPSSSSDDDSATSSSSSASGADAGFNQREDAASLRFALAAMVALGIARNDYEAVDAAISAAGVNSGAVVNCCVYKDLPPLFLAFRSPMFDVLAPRLTRPSEGPNKTRRALSELVETSKQILTCLVEGGANLNRTVRYKKRDLGVVEYVIEKSKSSTRGKISVHEQEVLLQLFSLVRENGDCRVAQELLRWPAIEAMIESNYSTLLVHPLVNRIANFFWSMRRGQAYRAYFVLLLLTILGTIVCMLSINFFYWEEAPNFFIRRNMQMQYSYDSFVEIKTSDEFWSWLEGPVVDASFSGSALDPGKQYQILRGIRVKQLRSIVDEEACSTFSFMQSEESDALCSSQYSRKTSDQEPFGPGETIEDNLSAFMTKEDARQSSALQRNVTLSSSVFETAFRFRRSGTESMEESKAYGNTHSDSKAYEGGGYAFDMLRKDANFLQAGVSLAQFQRDNLAALRSNNWVDHYTRVIIVDVPIWNPSVIRFGLTRFILELPAAGGFVASDYIMVNQLWCNCEPSRDWAVAITGAFLIICGLGSLYMPASYRLKLVVEMCERVSRLHGKNRIAEYITIAGGLLVAFLGALVYLLSELKYAGLEIILFVVILLEFVEKIIVVRDSGPTLRGRLFYAARPELILDLLLLPIFVGFLILQLIITRVTRPGDIEEYDSQDDAPVEYLNFVDSMYAMEALRIYSSFFVLFIWFRVLSLLLFVQSTGVFVIALQRLLVDSLKFGVLFVIVITGFSFSMMMAFSNEVGSFQDFGTSFLSLVDKGLVGELDYDELVEAHRYVGPILFTLFVITCVFVLLSLLISLFSSSYERLQANAFRQWTLAWTQQLRVYQRRAINFLKNDEECAAWIRFVGKTDDPHDPLFDREPAPIPEPTPSPAKEGDEV